jgi:polyribonucleotide nucleotidyltransferase
MMSGVNLSLTSLLRGPRKRSAWSNCEANEVTESIMVEALMLAHREIKRLCLWQKGLFKALDIQKREFVVP